MIHTMLGEDLFRKGMDLYFERHDGEACIVEQFIKCFADTSGEDFSQFMLWYSQAGTPELVCTLDHDEKAQTTTLHVTQLLSPSPGQEHKEAYHIPLKMGLLDESGTDLPLELTDGTKVEDGLLHVKKPEQSFTFNNIKKRPILSALRNFSAPVKLTTSADSKELLFLAAHDSDRYNRWQAMQSSMLKLLVDNVKAEQNSEPQSAGKKLGEALHNALQEKKLDPMFSPALLAFPGVNNIARELGDNIDHPAIYEVRKKLRAAIGEQLRDELTHIYETTNISGPFSPDAASAAKRSLRHACLGLLYATGEARDLERLYDHYCNANNMTEVANALDHLAQTSSPQRQKAFDDFYDKWKDDHVVIEKWFAFQAMSPMDDTLDQIGDLMKNPLFSLKNPNKARALIGAFAMNNPVQFNRADGKGYEFVARTIIKIDSFNPQIASRLLGSFKSWKVLEPGRRDKIKPILEDLAAHKGLSTDSFEIISKVIQ